jgi:hypothetical protein
MELIAAILKQERRHTLTQNPPILNIDLSGRQGKVEKLKI